MATTTATDTAPLTAEILYRKVHHSPWVGSYVSDDSPIIQEIRSNQELYDYAFDPEMRLRHFGGSYLLSDKLIERVIEKLLKGTVAGAPTVEVLRQKVHPAGEHARASGGPYSLIEKDSPLIEAIRNSRSLATFSIDMGPCLPVHGGSYLLPDTIVAIAMASFLRGTAFATTTTSANPEEARVFTPETLRQKVHPTNEYARALGLSLVEADSPIIEVIRRNPTLFECTVNPGAIIPLHGGSYPVANDLIARAIRKLVGTGFPVHVGDDILEAMRAHGIGVARDNNDTKWRDCPWKFYSTESPDAVMGMLTQWLKPGDVIMYVLSAEGFGISNAKRW